MGPDVGAAGQLILFFSITVLQALVSLIVFSYAAYSFLVVFVQTAAGNDEVIWPGDPIQDWFLKVWYLLWLLAVWAVPACLLLALFRLPRPLYAAGVLGVLWLMFPVTLLSSLSGTSRLNILRAKIVTLLARHAGTMFGFYLVTFLLLVACAGLWYLGIVRWTMVVPVAAGVGAIGFLLYARLLGRIGFLISRRSSEKSKSGQPERPEEAESAEEFVRRMAAEKAKAVFARIAQPCQWPILGADMAASQTCPAWHSPSPSMQKTR